MDSITKVISGKTWRFEKIPAVLAKDLLDKEVFDLRQYISARYNGSWTPLDNDEFINEVVPDWEVLVKLDNEIYGFNYGFLKIWKPTRVPSKMQSPVTAIECKHVDSLFSTLISNNIATYLELKTVYSLEDAFKLLEVLTVSKINEFNSYEASK